MSRGQCSLNTDNKSRKSSKVKLPLPSRENASQMRCLNGFSRSSSSTAISWCDKRTVDASPSVIRFGTISGRKSRKCLCTLQIPYRTVIGLNLLLEFGLFALYEQIKIKCLWEKRSVYISFIWKYVQLRIHLHTLNKNEMKMPCSYLKISFRVKNVQS